MWSFTNTNNPLFILHDLCDVKNWICIRILFWCDILKFCAGGDLMNHIAPLLLLLIEVYIKWSRHYPPCRCHFARTLAKMQTYCRGNLQRKEHSYIISVCKSSFNCVSYSCILVYPTPHLSASWPLTWLWSVSGQAASRLARIQFFWTHVSVGFALQDHPTGPLYKKNKAKKRRDTIEKW